MQIDEKDKQCGLISTKSSKKGLKNKNNNGIIPFGIVKVAVCSLLQTKLPVVYRLRGASYVPKDCDKRVNIVHTMTGYNLLRRKMS